MQNDLTGEHSCIMLRQLVDHPSEDDWLPLYSKGTSVYSVVIADHDYSFLTRFQEAVSISTWLPVSVISS